MRTLDAAADPANPVSVARTALKAECRSFATRIAVCADGEDREGAGRGGKGRTESFEAGVGFVEVPSSGQLQFVGNRRSADDGCQGIDGWAES